MMPYQSYQIYQAEQPEERRRDPARQQEQLGHMAKNVSWLWQHAIRRITLFRGRDPQPAAPPCSTRRGKTSAGESRRRAGEIRHLRPAAEPRQAQRPVHTGGRLSRNAAGPSCASALW